MGCLSEKHPSRNGNTLLVAASPTSKDNYPEVAAILATHFAQLLRLNYTRVVAGGHRWALQLFVDSEFPAITKTVGHEGHSVFMPCPCYLGIKYPTEAHSWLKAAFGTLQDLDCTHPPRTAAHLREMQGAYDVLGPTPAELGMATHMSVERSPVIGVPPSQNVPLLLHRTPPVKW